MCMYVPVLCHLQKKNLYIVIKNESLYFYALRLIIKIKTNMIIFNKVYNYFVIIIIIIIITIIMNTSKPCNFVIIIIFRMVLVMLMIFGKLMWMEVNQEIL